MRAKLAIAFLLLASSPALGFWECFPLRLAPAIHGARRAPHRPSIRYHAHHHRHCHRPGLHCIWIADDDSLGGGFPGEYASGEGDLADFPVGEGGLFGGGGAVLASQALFVETPPISVLIHHRPDISGPRGGSTPDIPIWLALLIGFTAIAALRRRLKCY